MDQNMRRNWVMMISSLLNLISILGLAGAIFYISQIQTQHSDELRCLYDNLIKVSGETVKLRLEVVDMQNQLFQFQIEEQNRNNKHLLIVNE